MVVWPLGTCASAFLMKWTRQRCQVAPTTRVMAFFNPSWASEITSFTPLSPRLARSRRKVVQKGSASADVQADDLALALGRDSHRNYGGDRNDAAAVAPLGERGIPPRARPPP